MSDLLTTTINVPAERAKLRSLRDEIARDVAHREAIQRKYSPRGFPLLPDVHPLEAAREQGNGAQPLRPLLPWTGVEVHPATADMRETQAGICGCCRGTQELGWEVLNREITGPSGSGA